MKIHKILVANRGEIAIRVMRSAKEMGIKTVAVFSEADRLAPHTLYADEAVCIGEAPSSQSYLRMETIIQVAKDLNVDAIHPGYGFLSENATFAQKVADARLIFIAPPPSAIRNMGSKLGAKEIAQRLQVPLVPGTAHAITDIPEAKRIAQDIGYPVLIKASAGGGGKGMRVVQNEQEFEEQMQRAISEAQSAFGDGAVFVEKYVSAPKHIEIQILGDQQGNIVYLFERECSIQRRHQKLIEEAPSPVVSPQMRKEMGECAVRLAKDCGYYSAGTVEFIVDEKLNFYFLEMNTRLQVEHPVTELITGLDLVKEQIKVAEGQSLSFTQEDLHIKGHSIEVRVCAEDPLNNFLPDLGKLTTYIRPQGTGVRIDDGVREGMQIPIYYDPMLAKLIVYGKDRTEAIARMKRAIKEYKITGVATTLQFCDWVLGHEQFVSGKFDTKFIENYYTPDKLKTSLEETEQNIAISFVSWFLDNQKNNKTQHNTQNNVNLQSKWRKNRV